MDELEGTYVIVVAKTGGHIFPGLALAGEIRSRRPQAPILFVGAGGELEEKLVPQAGFPIEHVRASGFVGVEAAGKLRALAGLPVGFLQARRLLERHRARAVAGMGGYVSVPVVAAAASLKIATLVHDSDAFPGLASRMLNRFVTATAVGLAEANRHLTRPGVVTGTPVRGEFFQIPPLERKASTRRLLVFGGSQGSAAVNRAMAAAAPLLAGAAIEVVHQTGERHLDVTREDYGTLPAGWRLEAFLPRLYEELAWADLVVSRAGAMTVAELAAAGRPAILIPFGRAAHGHQLENARALTAAGAAVTIEEALLTGQDLAGAVATLLSDRDRLVAMGQSARGLASPDAARRLADLLFEAEDAAGRGAGR
ncbi:MAG TPA: undecaprenyldiphospho-muramoylpentapeptide beta-N-acetylglucosaminyltransferase [Thermoanaerobaculia bacterium]|nr:undecaprenyldiphospho-muramoylpentapeptide beta-N-acetylglucosaminyltransferase [Thermoanaerobaculia bacterium]